MAPLVCCVKKAPRSGAELSHFHTESARKMLCFPAKTQGSDKVS